MKKFIKSILFPFWRLRFTPTFLVMRNFFAYSEVEEMYFKVMRFAGASGLEGDYLEFGLAWGNSFVTAYHCAQYHNLTGMKFYGFDSFEGLPEISGVDAKGFREFEKGQFSYGAEVVKKYVKKKGMDLSKVELVPGFYDKSLNAETKKKLPLKKAAVVMIDCDLYESTVPVLDFITGYIQEGTVIIFDDWYSYRSDPNRGEQRAFREWLEKNPSLVAVEYQKYSMGGNSFIIRNK